MTRRESILNIPLRIKRSKTETTEILQGSEDKIGQLFFSLPTEIQLQIVGCFDPVADLLTLRLVSRSFALLLDRNAVAVSRISSCRSPVEAESALWNKLYPFPQSPNGMGHMLGIWHRQAVVDGACHLVGDFVQEKIYRVKSNAKRRQQFAPRRRSMEEHFREPMLVLFHFFENTFQDVAVLLESTAGGQPVSVVARRSNCIDEYPSNSLIPAIQLARIFFSVYRQKLRPPSYAGSLERKCRGWNRPPATRVEMSRVIVYGGLEAMYKIINRPKYTERIDAMHSFLSRLETGSQSDCGERASCCGASETTVYNLEALTAQCGVFLDAARQRIMKEGLLGPDASVQDPYSYIESIFFHDQEPEGDGG